VSKAYVLTIKPLGTSSPHIRPTGARDFPLAKLVDVFGDDRVTPSPIIDSIILPKVLDKILNHGDNFKIGEIRSAKRGRPKLWRIQVRAEKASAG